MENIKIKIFPAFYGDCFLISIHEEEKVINILIDGGLSKTYEDYLKPILTEIAKERWRVNFTYLYPYRFWSH